MKIYEIGTGYTPIPAKMGAATEIVVEELTKSLLKKEKDVTIIDIEASDRIENSLPIMEVHVPSKFTGTDVQLGIMHKLKRVVYSVSLAFALKRILKKTREKVVLHFHNQYNMFFFLKLVPKGLRKKCFIAYTNHSYIWHGEWSEIQETVKKRYFQEITCMKNADMVFVLNEHTIDTLTNHIGIDSTKIRLIDNGVNTDIYRPLSDEENADLVSELGLNGKKVYLQIGSVCDRKNQLGALELLLPILKEDVNSVFAYAGGIISEEYQASIFEFAKKNGIKDQVLYMGELKPGETLNKYYNLADVMVFPSKSEGFSLVIIEAMSAGIPVIINENLQFKLSTECLKYKDGDDFIEVVKNSIINAETQKELSVKAREAVLKNYSWDKVAVDYLRSWTKKKGDKKMAKKNESEKKLNGTVIVTYRCNARCSMCNRYKAPSKPEEEISIETIKKLPKMYFTNITGGEPFIRTDLKDIVRELYKKSDRIVISTNGFFTDRIIDLAKEFPNIGIRISIEGLEQTNNDIRGLQDGYNRGYTTLKKLREMGMKDVGFGMTVQDKNAPDLVPLYKISDEMGMEFATASLHNSFYFVEAKNIIHDRPMVAKNFENLVNELLKSNSPKKWFRAYFNHGLINYIYGQKRLLPCDMSFDTFFIDPYGDVMPCNGTKDKEVMGNLNTQSWDELWNSKEAEVVRAKVRHCDRDCWMIGSVSPAMHKYIWKPATWVAIHKIKSLLGMKYSMYENKIVRDLRDGKVTKEELDKCSTCDMCAVVNNGLSEASKAQLVGKTGEEIVDADIAAQMKK